METAIKSYKIMELMKKGHSSTFGKLYRTLKKSAEEKGLVNVENEDIRLAIYLYLLETDEQVKKIEESGWKANTLADVDSSEKIISLIQKIKRDERNKTIRQLVSTIPSDVMKELYSHFYYVGEANDIKNITGSEVKTAIYYFLINLDDDDMDIRCILDDGWENNCLTDTEPREQIIEIIQDMRENK